MKSLSSNTGSVSVFYPRQELRFKLFEAGYTRQNPDNLGCKPGHFQLRHVQPGVGRTRKFSMILFRSVRKHKNIGVRKWAIHYFYKK